MGRQINEVGLDAGGERSLAVTHASVDGTPARRLRGRRRRAAVPAEKSGKSGIDMVADLHIETVNQTLP